MNKNRVRFVPAFFLVVLAFLVGCKEQILHDLAEHDANRVLAKLHQARISAEKIKQADLRWSIAVEDSETMQALTFLEENRILKDASSIKGERNSLVSNRDEQRHEIERKLSGEIESTLVTLRGVLDARVHLNLPVKDPLFGKNVTEEKGSSSILLVIESGVEIDREAVAQLVSGASGVPIAAISVLVDRVEKNPKREDAIAAPLPAEPLVLSAESFFQRLSVQIALSVLVVLGFIGVALYRKKHKGLSNLIAFSAGAGSGVENDNS